MGELFSPDLLPREVTFFSIWLLGVSMGLTACTVTCLPFMSSWVLGPEIDGEIAQLRFGHDSGGSGGGQQVSEW